MPIAEPDPAWPCAGNVPGCTHSLSCLEPVVWGFPEWTCSPRHLQRMLSLPVAHLPPQRALASLSHPLTQAQCLPLFVPQEGSPDRVSPWLGSCTKSSTLIQQCQAWCLHLFSNACAWRRQNEIAERYGFWKGVSALGVMNALEYMIYRFVLHLAEPHLQEASLKERWTCRKHSVSYLPSSEGPKRLPGLWKQFCLLHILVLSPRAICWHCRFSFQLTLSLGGQCPLGSPVQGGAP